MNIIEFINSKAIREHLAKFGDIFSPLDKAYLIYQARQKGVKEKISAMNELLENSEDFELKNVRWRFHYTDMTFHKLLKGYIETEQYLFDKFFEKEADAVYTYSISWNGEILEYNEPFADYKSCYDALLKEIADDGYIDETEIIKRYVKPSCSELTKTISAVFSKDLAFIHSVCPAAVYPSWYEAGLSELYPCSNNAVKADRKAIWQYKRYREIYDIFDEMWVDVPTPFKKGDILYGPYPFVMGYGHCEPFVLLDVCNNESKERTNKLKQSGDSSDMTAHGYWQSGNGQIYWECMHDYLSLEYYDGDLKEEKRILKALSSFIKGEIGAVDLMNLYRTILGEKKLKDLKCNMNFLEETMKLAGFED